MVTEPAPKAPRHSEGSASVSPLESYHRLTEAAVKCYGVFVWTTDLDTQLRGHTEPEILLGLVLE